MKIVHLTASRFFGGPERQMLELARHLPVDVRSIFVSFSEGGCCKSFLDQVRQSGCRGIVLKHDTPHLLAALQELSEVLRINEASVLCCHGYKANLLGLLVARRLRIPVVSISRGWTAETLRVRIYEALDRRVLRWMDKVVCVSAGQARKVHLAGIAESKTSVIRNAIDPQRFENPLPSYRERLHRLFPAPCSRIVAAAGRLSPEKGFSLLVDAAAEVLPKRPATGFVLFGEGALREPLSRQIVERGLQERFVLAGFRSDVDRFLPHLDLFVLPSFTEGLPNVALEALAAGVPVVATSVGGTPEVVEDGVNGYLVPAGNSSAIAARVSELLADDRLRQAMGTRGRVAVREHFTFASQAAEYLNIFAQLGVQPAAESALQETGCLRGVP